MVGLKWLENYKLAMAPLPNTATGPQGTLFLASQAWLASTLGGRGPARAGNCHCLPSFCSANSYQHSTAVGVWGSLRAAGEKVVSVLWGLCSVTAPWLRRESCCPSNCTGCSARFTFDERTQETPALRGGSFRVFLGSRAVKARENVPSSLAHHFLLRLTAP